MSKIRDYAILTLMGAILVYLASRIVGFLVSYFGAPYTGAEYLKIFSLTLLGVAILVVITIKIYLAAIKK